MVEHHAAQHHVEQVVGVRKRLNNLITFTSSTARFSRGGFAYFSAGGSTADLTRTRFYGLDPDNLIINAETIIREWLHRRASLPASSRSPANGEAGRSPKT